MLRFFGRRTILSLIALTTTVAVAAGVWWVAFGNALERVHQRAEADLALSADRLTNQLQTFGEHAVLLSGHPDLTQLVTGNFDDDQAAEAAAVLLDAADKTRALNLALYDAAGDLVVSAHPVPDRDRSIAGRADFERAMDGALGLTHRFDDANRRRISSYARPVFSNAGPILGALVLQVDVATIEAEWRADPTPVFFTTRSGRVLVSNRRELFGVRTESANDGVAVRDVRYVQGFELWTLDAGRYLPSDALHLVRPLPLIALTGEALASTAQAGRQAWLQSLAVGGLTAALFAFLFLATERRRALAERLAVEAALNERLEAKVRARTRELSDVNADLRREVSERKDAEAQLRAAQDNLVQAGKLSALGKMSAGISHELNQPLMAIQSFSENGKVLIDRGDTDAVKGNLGHIAELARRMGRIIKNLRAFSRQENIPIGNVDIAKVVEATLELVAPRATRDGIEVRWTPPNETLNVRAGEVRLQQVVLNLVSNAMDAVASSERQAITLWTTTADGGVTLHVADTGPGINEPEKIFDPFYSTKEVGQSEGMGLGLSISYGLAQSFGGGIQGRNRDEGGAEFTVDLIRVALDDVA